MNRIGVDPLAPALKTCIRWLVSPCVDPAVVSVRKKLAVPVSGAKLAVTFTE